MKKTTRKSLLEEAEKCVCGDRNKDGECPVLKGDTIEKYGLTENEIAKWCKIGCSVECGKLLEEWILNKRKKTTGWI